MRAVELPDLFIDDIPEQGVGECKAIITVLNKGNTNKYGNYEFAATFRHQDILQCPQSKIGLYLLYRFDLSDEELPNLETNENWFDIKLFRCSKSQQKNASLIQYSFASRTTMLYEMWFSCTKKRI